MPAETATTDRAAARQTAADRSAREVARQAAAEVDRDHAASVGRAAGVINRNHNGTRSVLLL